MKDNNEYHEKAVKTEIQDFLTKSFNGYAPIKMALQELSDGTINESECAEVIANAYRFKHLQPANNEKKENIDTERIWNLYSRVVPKRHSLTICLLGERIMFKSDFESVINEYPDKFKQPANNDYAVKMIEERIKILDALMQLHLSNESTNSHKITELNHRVDELNKLLILLTPNN